MELVLVRHALPVRRELTSGIADPELAPDGLRQAERLAYYLASEDIAAMYVSPLKRAQETAAPLAKRIGLTPMIDDDISEFDRNSNEYVPSKNCAARTTRAGFAWFAASGKRVTIIPIYFASEWWRRARG